MARGRHAATTGEREPPPRHRQQRATCGERAAHNPRLKHGFASARHNTQRALSCGYTWGIHRLQLRGTLPSSCRLNCAELDIVARHISFFDINDITYQALTKSGTRDSTCNAHRWHRGTYDWFVPRLKAAAAFEHINNEAAAYHACCALSVDVRVTSALGAAK